jgi:hypothetical protein
VNGVARPLGNRAKLEKNAPAPRNGLGLHWGTVGRCRRGRLSNKDEMKDIDAIEGLVCLKARPVKLE